MSVDPSDISVLDPTKDNRLTLTTCTPRFSATQRLVVSATLIGQVDPTPVPVVQSAPAAIPGDTPTPTAGLSGKGVSTLPGVAWGLACAAVWFLAWLIGRKRHKWLAYAVASPVFLVLLFIFFENTARFVPGNI
jgi:sortase A